MFRGLTTSSFLDVADGEIDRPSTLITAVPVQRCLVRGQNNWCYSDTLWQLVLQVPGNKLKGLLTSYCFEGCAYLEVPPPFSGPHLVEYLLVAGVVCEHLDWCVPHNFTERWISQEFAHAFDGVAVEKLKFFGYWAAVGVSSIPFDRDLRAQKLRARLWQSVNFVQKGTFIFE